MKLDKGIQEIIEKLPVDVKEYYLLKKNVITDKKKFREIIIKSYNRETDPAKRDFKHIPYCEIFFKEPQIKNIVPYAKKLGITYKDLKREYVSEDIQSFICNFPSFEDKEKRLKQFKELVELLNIPKNIINKCAIKAYNLEYLYLDLDDKKIIAELFVNLRVVVRFNFI